MTYLFFDIECANSFGGIGKICSFGYVLCNQDFSIIESDDLLIDPNAPFDWYLFKEGAKCNLAYSRIEYLKNPKFAHYFSKINSLLSAKDRLVFGFGCQNDVMSIVTECMRYDLPDIEFYCNDILPAVEKFYEAHGGLGFFVERLEIPKNGMEFHDSKADAFFTMKVAERFSQDSKKSLDAIFKAYTPIYSGQTKDQRIKKLYKKALEREQGKAPERKRRARGPKRISIIRDFDYKKELALELEEQAKDR